MTALGVPIRSYKVWALAETDTRLDPGRLDELISRARRQADLLEELRLRAAEQLIGREPGNR
jgi:hypothetical protein